MAQKASKNVNTTVLDNSIMGISDLDVINQITDYKSKYQILEPQDKSRLINLELEAGKRELNNKFRAFSK